MPGFRLSPVTKATQPFHGQASGVWEARPYQLIVPSTVVTPPVPLDQCGGTLQFQEVGPEREAAMGDSRADSWWPESARAQLWAL